MQNNRVAKNHRFKSTKTIVAKIHRLEASEKTINWFLNGSKFIMRNSEHIAV